MIDSDTYQASKEALDFCLDTLREGTFIIFDDFMFYKGSYEKGEIKAFNDFKSQNKNIIFRKVLKYGMGCTAFVVFKID